MEQYNNTLLFVVSILFTVIAFFLAQIYFQIQAAAKDLSELKGDKKVYEEKFKNIETDVRHLKGLQTKKAV